MHAKKSSQEINIFLIDDVEINNFITARLLNRIIVNPQLTVFTNGLQALEKLKLMRDAQEKFPDFIFLDIHMPIMNGWDFLQELENLNIDSKETVEIHILSSSVCKDEVKRANRFPSVKSFIRKPTSLLDLRSIFQDINSVEDIY